MVVPGASGAVMPTEEGVMAAPEESSPSRQVFPEDVVCHRSNRSRIGVVVAIANDSDSDPDYSSDDSVRRHMDDDHVCVQWLDRYEPRPYHEDQVEVVDRSFFPGDIVCRETDTSTSGKSGTVIATEVLLDVRTRFGRKRSGKVIKDVPSWHLRPTCDITRGCHVTLTESCKASLPRAENEPGLEDLHRSEDLPELRDSPMSERSAQDRAVNDVIERAPEAWRESREGPVDSFTGDPGSESARCVREVEAVATRRQLPDSREDPVMDSEESGYEMNRGENRLETVGFGTHACTSGTSEPCLSCTVEQVFSSEFSPPRGIWKVVKVDYEFVVWLRNGHKKIVVPQKSMLDIPYGEDLSEEWDGHDLIGRKVKIKRRNMAKLGHPCEGNQRGVVVNVYPKRVFIIPVLLMHEHPGEESAEVMDSLFNAHIRYVVSPRDVIPLDVFREARWQIGDMGYLLRPVPRATPRPPHTPWGYAGEKAIHEKCGKENSADSRPEILLLSSINNFYSRDVTRVRNNPDNWVQVIRSVTVVTVRWQNGEVESQILGKALRSVRHIDDHEFLPLDFVALRTETEMVGPSEEVSPDPADPEPVNGNIDGLHGTGRMSLSSAGAGDPSRWEEPRFRYGVVLHADSQERMCRVRWVADQEFELAGSRTQSRSTSQGGRLEGELDNGEAPEGESQNSRVGRNALADVLGNQRLAGRDGTANEEDLSVYELVDYPDCPARLGSFVISRKKRRSGSEEDRKYDPNVGQIVDVDFDGRLSVLWSLPWRLPQTSSVTRDSVECTASSQANKVLEIMPWDVVIVEEDEYDYESDYSSDDYVTSSDEELTHEETLRKMGLRDWSLSSDEYGTLSNSDVGGGDEPSDESDDSASANSVTGSDDSRDSDSCSSDWETCSSDDSIGAVSEDEDPTPAVSHAPANSATEPNRTPSVEESSSGQTKGQSCLSEESSAVAAEEEAIESLDEQFIPLDVAPVDHLYLDRSKEAPPPKVILKEWQRLKRGLPLGVTVWTFQNRIDLLRFAICGAAGTPYEGGIFVFDLKFPQEYPRTPPLVAYHSRVNDKLNPNLYTDGTICLSLLGTWDGRDEETWTEQSTVLQVIVSIQGLVLVEEPYYCEAGYDKQKGAVVAQRNSKLYNERATLLTIQSAISLLRSPLSGLEGFIAKHLREGSPTLKRRCERLNHSRSEGKTQENLGEPRYAGEGEAETKDEDSMESAGTEVIRRPTMGFLRSLEQALTSLDEELNRTD